jgi:carbon monoxide dehydrogenase subunit G
MRIDGHYLMSGDRADVYATLSDPEALAGCLPGCERFVETSPGRYETVLRFGLLGIKGTFTGAVTLADPRPPESYRLAVEGTFAGGTIKGVADISLSQEGVQTRVQYAGDGQVGGPLASVGQRLLVPAARSVITQFFTCLGEKTAANSGGPATTPSHEQSADA